MSILKNFITLCCVAFLVFSCAQQETTIYKNQNTGAALGTSYSLIYLSKEKLDFQREIDSVFGVVNQSLSTYMPDSDISKINRGDTTVVVDHMFQEVFKLSKEIHKSTAGYFDPTVGSLVNAWGFGPGEQIELDSVSVDSLMQFVGFQKVELTSENTIKKEHVNITFDFNAIAKGYAIDRLAKLMNQKGINNYLLEVGGELVSKGKNVITDKLWSIGIDDPQIEEGRQLKLVITLKDKALASSGNYRKFRIDAITGEKFVHTINPKTGYTKNGKVLAANVLAADCATADAYATAFMAMSLENSIALLNEHQELEGYIIYLDSEGVTQEFMTPRFQSRE